MSDYEEDYDDDEELSISLEGLHTIMSWIRFQVQMCELEHKELLESGGECPDQNHMVALLMGFIVIPMLELVDPPKGTS